MLQSTIMDSIQIITFLSRIQLQYTVLPDSHGLEGTLFHSTLPHLLSWIIP